MGRILGILSKYWVRNSKQFSLFEFLPLLFHIVIHHYVLLKTLLDILFRSAASLESNRSGPHASNTSIASSGFIFSYKAEVQHQFNFFESSVRTDEVKLKDFVTRLKNARSSIQSTIATDLESMHAEDGGPERTNVNENRTADLEMAVLVQVNNQ